MPYKGSYVWRVRQKIGHDLLVIPSADCIAIDDIGRLLLVYNKDFGIWVFPGGYAEENQSSQVCAARELLEEGGLETNPDMLIPFAFCSGHTNHYPNGDITQPYTQYFIAREWTDSNAALDAHEVTQRKWFSVDELAQADLSTHVRRVIEAYEMFERTHQYQMIMPEGR